MAEKPLLYLVLGAPRSGRRELVFDLIRGGLDSDAKPVVIISDQEALADAKPEASTAVAAWTWNGVNLDLDVPSEFTHIFLLADGRSNPVDQVEAFAAWLPGQEIELARIITVVSAQLAFEHKELLRWYEACIHFSDVVLINRREQVDPKWIANFIDHFKKEQHYPCHFEQVKQGKVKNPPLLLEPEPRRISLIFDELPVLEEDEEDETDLDSEETGDPYIRRLPSGRREKQIPEITRYIGE